MSKEIIINVSGDQSRIAIVEDGSLVELYVENPDNVRTLGDIYLAQVRRILPGIKAAFVDIGQKQDAFLHFSDLSDNVPELLELAEGRIKERSARDLPTIPPSEGVEPETAEEQLATRRRRDVKRSRSGRKQDAETAAETPAAEAASPQEAFPQEAFPQEAAAEAPASRRGSRRRGPAAPAPAILPPDADGALQEPSEDDAADAPEARADETAEAGEEQRSSRRRRRGRRPKGGAQTEESAPEAPADAAGDEAPPAEPAQDEEAQKPSRRRGSRRRGQEGAEASPDETSQAQAAEAPAQEDEPAEAPKPRSRRRGKAEPAPEVEPTPEVKPTSEEAAGEAKEPSSRGRGRGRRRDAEAAPAEEPTHLESPRIDVPRPEARKAEVPKPAEAPKAEEAPKPEPAASGPARLVPSSRFVIDLTAKGGRSGPPRREEEEEEEERTSARRSRRASRDDDGDDDGYEREPVRNGSSNGSARRGKPPEAYLRQDQRIIVKIIKEPISAKGSRVSTDISLAGRFLVLVPAADYVAVSKKIESSKERRRLRALARSLLPEGFGLIVRTVADGRDAKALDTDLKLLLKKWYKAEEVLKGRPKPPVQLYEDVNMVSSIVRDLFSEDYDRITVDDPKVYRTIKTYVQAVAPHMAELVHLHKGAEPVFRKHKVEKDVRAAFESRVSLPGGGYLFIETTEAMHVVDVNSGRAGRGKSQEENALTVNLEAAREIAKQLRLRDLGGIICVDFIDMRSDSYRKKVYDELKREFRRDRAVTKLLPMSDFGVVEITRQRLRPSITTTLDVDDIGPAPPEEEETTPEAASASEAAPAMRQEEASAPGRSASEVVAHLERWLGTYRKEVSDEHRKRPILVRVHPFLAAYLQRGIPNQLTRWKFKTWLNFHLDVDDAADPLAFSVRDEKSGKNLTKKYDKV
jgi:Rne/Rng family ribonuclease